MSDRHKCPSCGRQVSTRNDGRLRRHGKVDLHLSPVEGCPGSGLLVSEPRASPSTERFNEHERLILVAVGKACKLSPSGWAEARDIASFAFATAPNYRQKGGAIVAPTLTLLRAWDKPLVEARDSGYGHKEYRLTPRGKRARTHKGVSPVPG